MPLTPDASTRPLAQACLPVVAFALAVAVVVRALAPRLDVLHLQVGGGLAAAVASGLLIASGALRLARWRLLDDRHSAWLGAALLLMGGVCLPLDGLARRAFPADDAALWSAGARCALSLTAMAMLTWTSPAARRGPDADAVPEHRSADGNPAPLLVAVAALVLTSTTLVVDAQGLGMAPFSVGVLSSCLVGGWWWTALRVTRSYADAGWARRGAPLYVGMGIGEGLRALDTAQVHGWTLAGMLVIAAMAVLSTRSSLLDLDGAVDRDRQVQQGMSAALDRAGEEAQALLAWRERVTHDARNAFVGLRAAMDLWERFEGRVDAGTSARLREAAVAEIRHLEDLLGRTEPEPVAHVDVLALAEDLGATATALGTGVVVSGTRQVAAARPGDLEVVLKNLLANARSHAAGATVTLEVSRAADQVVLVCADDGPGVAADVADRLFERGVSGRRTGGTGLGLHAARDLLRRQGGDLLHVPSAVGARFVVVLPVGPAEVPGTTGTAGPATARADHVATGHPARPDHARHPARAEHPARRPSPALPRQRTDGTRRDSAASA